jgi:hypothetical protein
MKHFGLYFIIQLFLDAEKISSPKNNIEELLWCIRYAILNLKKSYRGKIVLQSYRMVNGSKINEYSYHHIF